MAVSRTWWILAVCALAQDGVSQSANPDSALARALALLERNCADCIGADGAAVRRAVILLEETWEGGVRDTTIVVDAIEGAMRNLAYVFDTARTAYWLERRLGVIRRWLRQRPDEPQAILLYATELPVESPERDSLLLTALRIAPHEPNANRLYGVRLLQLGDRERAEPYLIRGVCPYDPEGSFRVNAEQHLQSRYGFRLRCPERLRPGQPVDHPARRPSTNRSPLRSPA